MLYIPEVPGVYRILGIDPGTNTLGVAIIDLDLVNKETSLIMATTIHGGKNSKNFPSISDVHGDRRAKLFAHQKSIRYILEQYRPNSIISESPYMGKFANAFEALVECLMAIRDEVYNYDHSITLETVDPPTAKKAVGAPGRGGDKSAVRDAVLKLQELKNKTGSSLGVLDEHTIDAIAVAYYKLQLCSKDFI